MRKLTINEAAKMLGVCPQQVRVMIQNKQICGASYHVARSRKTYYITDEHINKFMKGGSANETE